MSLGEDVADEGLDLGPAAGHGPVPSTEAHRSAALARLHARLGEQAELLNEKISLGKQKGDAKRRDAIHASALSRHRGGD